MIEHDQSLTALERELLIYVERLTEASEQSAVQFKALQDSSSDMINERQAATEQSLKLLIGSQASLVSGLIAFANTLDRNVSLPPELIDSQTSIRQALEQLKAET